MQKLRLDKSNQVKEMQILNLASDYFYLRSIKNNAFVKFIHTYIQLFTFLLYSAQASLLNNNDCV